MEGFLSKVYIISGEASGDLHGSNLIKALKGTRPDLDIRCWGGDLMEDAGGKVVKHYRDLAFMGFVEVVANLRTIKKNFKFCEEDVAAFDPDVLVLIDYPGFNLRIAKWASNRGIKVVYYISPQVWAWKENRVRKIKKYVDRMMVILPFEKGFYAKHNFDVDFVGHPLVDAVEDYKRQAGSAEVIKNQLGLDDRPVLSLLPGSRKQEVRVKLPIMLEAARNFPTYQVLIAKAPSLDNEFYSEFDIDSNVSVIDNKTYDLLMSSDLAMVTSGTATLETGLFKVPQVVCYKGNKISYLIIKNLIKIKYISLVNLILDRKVVTELIQDELTPENITKELSEFLTDKGKARIESDYNDLLAACGGVGASSNAANLVLKTLDEV